VLGVQRIEIVKGPYSALYGSNALGGVINIVTSPVPDRAQMAARVYVGAYDIPAQERFTDRAPLTRGLEVEQSLPLGKADGRLFLGRVSDDGFTQNGRSSRWLGRAELALPGPQGRSSSLYAIWSQEDIGEFFGWRSPDHRLEVPPDAVGDWYRNDWLNLGATINAFALASSSLRFDPYLYYDAVQNHFHDNTDYHRANRMGSTAQLALLPGAGQSLTLGGEAAYTTVTSNILGRPTLTDLALFAQDEASLRRGLKLSAGARLDDHRVNPGHEQAQLSPKLGLVYAAGPALSLRVSASRGFRTASPVEQFVSTVQYGIQVVPNPDLRAEHVTAAEIGATATPGRRVWLDGAIFQSEYRDLIQPAPVPGRFFVFQFRNVDRARVRGLDLETRFAAMPDVLSLDVTYMFLDTRDLLTGSALPYRSAHTGTATLELLQGLVALDLQYRSRVEQVLQYPLDPRGTSTLLGLRGAYRFRGMLLQLRASNLLQAEYVDLQERFPGPPRSVLLMASHGI
jgi:outer membrane receptor for ferrienterochelin and colicins